MPSDKPPLKEVPDVVVDHQSNRYFTKGRFLGKGGFARCYELIDNSTKAVYAGKVRLNCTIFTVKVINTLQVVSKTLLGKKHQRDKVCICCVLYCDLCYCIVCR